MVQNDLYSCKYLVVLSLTKQIANTCCANLQSPHHKRSNSATIKFTECEINILNKSENATPKLFAIYIQKNMQTKNANESVS